MVKGKEIGSAILVMGLGEVFRKDKISIGEIIELTEEEAKYNCECTNFVYNPDIKYYLSVEHEGICTNGKYPYFGSVFEEDAVINHYVRSEQ